MPRTLPILLAITLVALSAAPAGAQIGPDVIVGALVGTANYGGIGGKSAFAVGTTSCNAGDQVLPWIAGTAQHPVIALNLYRIESGTFEQIGMAWLKHGFGALQQNLCSPCTSSGSFSALGVGCSDPYCASLNGSQSGLGPRFEVNAATGVFPYPYTSPSTPATIGRRLQADNLDLDPATHAGATYLVEGHYVTPDDAQAGNGNNNASYRLVNFSPNGGNFSLSYASGSSTVQQRAAIEGWQDLDPSVQLEYIDIPNDGRLILAYKSSPAGGGLTRHEFAIHNLNSDRSVRSVSIEIGTGAAVSQLRFNDVDYHSGEPTDSTDWPGSYAGSAVTWTTDTFAVNQDANAIRWSTTYSFGFTSDAAPGTVNLGLFKPGTPANMTTSVAPAPFTISFPNGVPSQINADETLDVDVQTTNLAGFPDPATANLFVSVNGGPFSSSPLAYVGGSDFIATLPSSPCFSQLQWYVSITDQIGTTTISEPPSAALNTTAVVPAALATTFSDNFETDLGWTVTNSAGLSDGAWERGVPIGGGDRGDPPTDADGSGQCYLTDNVDGNSDVDGGLTTLTSPVFDLSAFANAQFSFDFWYDNAFSVPGATTNADIFDIELSDDGGSTWTLVESYNAHTDQWNHRDVTIGSYVNVSNQVQIRFIASDLRGGSVVEAGLDAFSVELCEVLPEACAAGNVGATAGGPFDVLEVDGSSGGSLRLVTLGLNQAFSIGMAQPPSTMASQGFAIFGRIGVPDTADAYVLPVGIGTMCFAPCIVQPTNPALFMLTNNFGPSNRPQILGSNPTPWTVPIAGLPFAAEFTLQGVMFDPTAPSGLAVTNGVVGRIEP